MATKFEWGWNDSELQADNLMTRQRAARLLSAWRRTSRQYQNGGCYRMLSAKGVIKLERIARHQYRATSEYGETATIKWEDIPTVMQRAMIAQPGERRT